MAKQTPRLHYLDALRGWAAFLVVLYHYTTDQMYEHNLHGAGLWVGQLFEGSLNVGKYAVVLFFLISGYIIPASLGDTGDRIGRFCIGRFFRLYPLYWAALAVSVLLYWADANPGLTQGVVLANVTMVQGYLGKPSLVLAAWTLQIELTYYAICVVMAALHKLSSPRACTLVSLGFLVAALLMAIIRNEFVVKLPLALPLALSLNFFATVWQQATLVENPEAKRIAPWLLVTIIVALVPICLIGYSHDFGFGESSLQYIICYVSGLCTFALCTTKFRVNWRPLVFLGELSYSIYLVHTLVSTANYQLGWTAPRLGLDPAIYIAGQMLIVLPFAWLTFRFIEQPAIRMGRRVIRARSSPGPAQATAGPAL